MNWEGFLMGVSDFGLERLKEERQKKMQKDLLELQQKYARESAKFTQKLKDKSDAKRVHETIETEDGMMQGVNVFNQPVGEARELSPWEISKREREKEKHESDISYRDKTLSLKEQELAERRRANAIAAQASVPDLPTSDEGVIERTFKSIFDLAKNAEERAYLAEQATSVYTDAMSEPEPADPAQLRMRLMERMLEGPHRGRAAHARGGYVDSFGQRVPYN